jgi:citrate lyase subunit gamma (acyl carrier protein)
MKPKFKAQAGTFESSDILVLIEPGDDNSGVVIDLESTVMFQFGNDIRDEIDKQVANFELEDAHLILKDKGALSATISARVETAIRRSLGIQEGTGYSNEI